MFKQFLILCIVFNGINCLSQKSENADLATHFYMKGIEAFNNKQFAKADSLYTVSLKLQPHVDTYFNRAMARINMNNKQGYCEDMAFASGMHDKEASGLFIKHCGTMDTVFLNIKNEPCTRTSSSFHNVIYKSKFMEAGLAAHYEFNARLLKFTWFRESNEQQSILKPQDSTFTRSDSIYEIVDEQAEFPGGIPALMEFIQSNLQYPAVARDKGISTKVFSKFVINTFGHIENIEILKVVPDSRDFDREVIRLIKSMPPWKPAKHNGVTVKCYFNLPISFRIQK